MPATTAASSPGFGVPQRRQLPVVEGNRWAQGGHEVRERTPGVAWGSMALFFRANLREQFVQETLVVYSRAWNLRYKVRIDYLAYARATLSVYV